jgi:hypothetical protein
LFYNTVTVYFCRKCATLELYRYKYVPAKFRRGADVTKALISEKKLFVTIAFNSLISEKKQFVTIAFNSPS